MNKFMLLLIVLLIGGEIILAKQITKIYDNEQVLANGLIVIMSALTGGK